MFLGETMVVPPEDLQIDKQINYVEKPISILRRKNNTLLNKEFGLVNVQ